MTKSKEHDPRIPFAGLSRLGGPSPALEGALERDASSRHDDAVAASLRCPLPLNVSYRRIATAGVGLAWTTKNPRAFIHAGFSDFLGRC